MGLFKRSQRVSKGAPSGFVVSLIFHGAVFFIAGLFVVFTVVNKPEPEFEPPPPIERPKMKLKKPKVKVRKSSNPKPSSRIVAKVKTKEMPEIQLPDLVGAGEGLLGGSGFGGEFMDLPEIQNVSLMGSENSIGSDLVGTYYDFKRNRNGKFNGMALKNPSNKFTGVPAADKYEWLHTIYTFIKNGCDPNALSRYYHSPRKLYASCVVIPTTYSAVAPVAFDTIDSGGGLWMVHYKGKLVHKDGITFRFVCASDYFIVIRVDGEIVWGGVWYPQSRWKDYMDLLGGLYEPKLETRGGFIGNDRASAGEWITLEPGVPKDIDILIGDEDGKTSFCVAIEEEGAEYEKNKFGYPIYPVFKTAEISRDMLDKIYRALPEGEVCVTNGPVFNDFGAAKAPVPKDESSSVDHTAEEERAQAEMRTWTLKDGRTVDAELIRTFFDKLVLKNAEGDEVMVPREDLKLSDEDQNYLELQLHPELKIEFRKSIEQKNFEMVRGAEDRVPEERATFGAKVKLLDKFEYDHPLTVEFFAIGSELYGNRYLLLDRASSTFVPSKADQYTHEFYSKRLVILTDLLDEVKGKDYTRLGERYEGFLITVKDERGKVIGIDGSKNWLEEYRANLEKLRVGNYFDKTCTRTFPTRPKSYMNENYATRP